MTLFCMKILWCSCPFLQWKSIKDELHTARIYSTWLIKLDRKFFEIELYENPWWIYFPSPNKWIQRTYETIWYSCESVGFSWKFEWLEVSNMLICIFREAVLYSIKWWSVRTHVKVSYQIFEGYVCLGVEHGIFLREGEGGLVSWWSKRECS